MKPCQYGSQSFSLLSWFMPLMLLLLVAQKYCLSFVQNMVAWSSAASFVVCFALWFPGLDVIFYLTILQNPGLCKFVFCFFACLLALYCYFFVYKKKLWKRLQIQLKNSWSKDTSCSNQFNLLSCNINFRVYWVDRFTCFHCKYCVNLQVPTFFLPFQVSFPNMEYKASYINGNQCLNLVNIIC
jgi:hypothetical protein